MTPYQQYQQEKYGNYLPESPCATYEQTDEDGERWMEVQGQLQELINEQ